MKRIILFFFLILVATTGFADSLILNNQISDAISNNKRIAIQWATSAKEVDESNNKIKEGKKLNLHSLQLLTQKGKINVDIPKNAEYFRVLTWSKAAREPDFLTNWVDIIPNKTYTLNEDHLIPLVLMFGMGC